MSTRIEREDRTVYRRTFTEHELEDMLIAAIEAETGATLRKRSPMGVHLGQSVRMKRTGDQLQNINIEVAVDNTYVETQPYSNYGSFGEI